MATKRTSSEAEWSGLVPWSWVLPHSGRTSSPLSLRMGTSTHRSDACPERPSSGSFTLLSITVGARCCESSCCLIRRGPMDGPSSFRACSHSGPPTFYVLNKPCDSLPRNKNHVSINPPIETQPASASYRPYRHGSHFGVLLNKLLPQTIIRHPWGVHPLSIKPPCHPAYPSANELVWMNPREAHVFGLCHSCARSPVLSIISALCCPAVPLGVWLEASYNHRCLSPRFTGPAVSKAFKRKAFALALASSRPTPGASVISSVLAPSRLCTRLHSTPWTTWTSRRNPRPENTGSTRHPIKKVEL
jgi:hypothetical protein